MSNTLRSDLVRAIRDERGFEVGWYCNGCGEPKNALWCGLCKACQAIERRHSELVAACEARCDHSYCWDRKARGLK